MSAEVWRGLRVGDRVRFYRGRLWFIVERTARAQFDVLPQNRLIDIRHPRTGAKWSGWLTDIVERRR